MRPLDYPNLAFIGKAGAGKSTAAEFLTKEFAYIRLSFAHTLRLVAQYIWGDDMSKDRDKLQRLGVAVREIDEDAWVNAEFRRVAPGARYVIDDCRFPNEYERLREEGFVFVRLGASRGQRIVRLRANGKLQDEAQLDHVSETALDGWPADYTIENEDDLHCLKVDILGVLDKEARKR